MDVATHKNTLLASVVNNTKRMCVSTVEIPTLKLDAGKPTNAINLQINGDFFSEQTLFSIFPTSTVNSVQYVYKMEMNEQSEKIFSSMTK
jgi:hypothetical protein